MKGLIAKKIGMTQVFDDEGNLVPVTVIHVEPNTIVARKTKDSSGYDAAVLGFGNLKKNHTLKPYAGQFSEGIEPKKLLREFRDFDGEQAAGETIGIELFDGERYLDVTAISKGKGTQGVMKRYGFKGGRASHGSKFHREPGSTGQCTTPGHSFKNTKLPGRMGREKVTVQNLRVIKIDTELNVVMVRGAVPGSNGSTLIVKTAVKK
jgi:large subunit ribosomal protein L3